MSKIDAEFDAVVRELCAGERSERGNPFQSELERPARAEIRLLLSPRENEIVALLLDGLSDKEIAVQLKIAHASVRARWPAIFAKMRARNRVQVALNAAGYMQQNDVVQKK